MPTTDTVVIGASAAGLATAACLADVGIEHVVVERADEVGSAWRSHYKRLHLHTPKSGSALPGLKFPRGLPKYPAREDVVAYLEAYRAEFGIEPHFGETVSSVSRRDGGWTTRSDKATYTSTRVVVATGHTHTPVIPTWPDEDTFRGDVLHSSAYVDGSPWDGKQVLVVGFGNSACEIAIDLHEHGALPQISVRHPVNVIPRDVLGVPVLRLGIVGSHMPPRLADMAFAPLLRATVGGLNGTGLRKLPYGPMTQIAEHGTVPLLDIGTLELIRTDKLKVRPAIERFLPGGVRFTDGTEGEFAAVVLGTGYRPDVGDFLEVDEGVVDTDGQPLSSGEESAMAGLYFCGFRVVPTGQLREIGREAKAIAKAIAAAAA